MESESKILIHIKESYKLLAGTSTIPSIFEILSTLKWLFLLLIESFFYLRQLFDFSN